ncbi:MAG: SLC13 family permease [Cypionkella sp.]
MIALPETIAPIIALILVAALFVMFMLELYPPEVIAGGVAATFMALGLVSGDDALAAFSNPAPLTIAAMFVVSGALVRTGMLDALAAGLIRASDTSPKLALAGFVLATMAVSAIANNTPVVLVLIPVVIKLSQRLGIAETRTLIPLSYIAILGGTLTLVGTSTNLLVAGVASREGIEAFSIFEVTPVGLIVGVVGVAAMAILGPLLLPNRSAEGTAGADQDPIYLTEITFGPNFDALGKAVSEVASLNRNGLKLIAVREQGALKRDGVQDLIITESMTLIARTDMAELLTLKSTKGIAMGVYRSKSNGDDDTDRIVGQALVKPSRRKTDGKISTLSAIQGNGMTVLAAYRPGHSFGPDLQRATLRPADVLLLEGSKDAFQRLDRSNDLVPLGLPNARPYRRSHAPVAALVLLMIVALAAFGVADIAVLALIGVAVLLVTRCLDSDEAWRFLDGGILVLIFSMLIIGNGLQNTGAVALLADAIAPALTDLPPIFMLAAIYILTSILTEIVSNNAVAIVVTPLAISLAGSIGVDPRPMVVAVMFGASASFATPIGYQTNTLVYGAGNYRFSDFLKIGVPMNIIVGIASVLVIPIFFPF